MTFLEVLRQHSPMILLDGQVEMLARHYVLLRRWNKVMNLTAIDDLEEAVLRHYCESLFLAKHLPQEPISIADVGSGPGFPGFPVAVVRPDCRVALIESNQRKAVFLREVSRELTNIRVLACRAEEIEEHFDWVISRAVQLRDVLRARLSQNYALLVGEEHDGVPLPWGNNRKLHLRST